MNQDSKKSKLTTVILSRCDSIFSQEEINCQERFSNGVRVFGYRLKSQEKNANKKNLLEIT